jgi:site-specific recombinase XerC
LVCKGFRSALSGHITTIDKQFRKARADAGLPEGLKLYCDRHDFGTEMLQRTGNLALVMRVMGQTSTKAAMQYQHPDLEHIRMALNVARAKTDEEKRVNKTWHILRHSYSNINWVTY